MNTQIRLAIYRFLQSSGPTDSRAVISRFAAQFQTTKQRIAGNISHMVCNMGTVAIRQNYPHSVLYLPGLPVCRPVK